MMERATMTVPEVAQVLGVCEVAVYDMLKAGVIPNLRWGKRFIIAKPAFEAWLATCGAINKAVN